MLIWRSMRPSKIVEYVKNNSPTSVTGTPGDTWRKFLKDSGATGETIYDMEQAYLRSQGATTWDRFLNALGYTFGVIRDRMRSWLDSISTPPTSDRYLSEAGDLFQLEDGSGYYLLES